MKLLLGGSPCTHWSIAQTKNRETEPKGLGWELFENYLIALEKFKSDFFLYENNKSMSAEIREQITKELGVEPILINSALLSAQNRQRLYWTNIPGVEQPQDRGLILLDVLDSGMVFREKGCTLKANYAKASAANALDSGHYPAPMAIEPVNITIDGKVQCLRATYYKDGIRNMVGNTVDQKTCVAHPVYIGAIADRVRSTCEAPLKEEKVGVLPNGAGELTQCQSKRIYSVDAKGRVLNAGPGGLGVQTGLYAVPVRVGDMPNAEREIKGGQAHRVYDADGKAVTLTARPNGGGLDVPLYEVRTPIEYNPLKSCDVVVTDQNIRCTYKDGSGTAQGYTVYFDDVKGPSVIAGHAHKMKIIEPATGKEWPVYEVRNCQITIQGKQYPIKLADGFYIIRKLTVRECMRLQTVPESFVFPVSDTQAYKMLGNGWTVDVIAHILHYAPGITTEPLEVLSMYDGMSCGHLALNKLGAHIAHYYATEIDKYAIQTTQHNFPDTIQLGDAFQVRENGWKIKTED